MFSRVLNELLYIVKKSGVSYQKLLRIFLKYEKCNLGQKIRIVFHVLIQFSFTTNETERDYYQLDVSHRSCFLRNKKHKEARKLSLWKGIASNLKIKRKVFLENMSVKGLLILWWSNLLIALLMNRINLVSYNKMIFVNYNVIISVSFIPKNKLPLVTKWSYQIIKCLNISKVIKKLYKNVFKSCKIKTL